MIVTVKGTLRQHSGFVLLRTLCELSQRPFVNRTLFVIVKLTGKHPYLCTVTPIEVSETGDFPIKDPVQSLHRPFCTVCLHTRIELNVGSVVSRIGLDHLSFTPNRIWSYL